MTIQEYNVKNSKSEKNRYCCLFRQLENHYYVIFLQYIDFSHSHPNILV
jgi:hypothetical protein